MKRLKQSQLAKELGISKSYLSMILSGQRTPNPELAERISSLGVVNFEANFSLRGRCPKPLDECATKKLAGDSGTISNFLRPDLIPKLRELLRKSRV